MIFSSQCTTNNKSRDDDKAFGGRTPPESAGEVDSAPQHQLEIWMSSEEEGEGREEERNFKEGRKGMKGTPHFCKRIAVTGYK